ncbi:MAG: cupredoxin domain-containing protein [Anaerolineae bacterium]|nr:cupredoxin domain-containing protein [Anaerolineae bacterium]MDK1081946.1 cupredoxin domain-containing protein [Anaerolineae bacterium]
MNTSTKHYLNSNFGYIALLFCIAIYLSACSGPQRRTIELIGDDMRFVPDMIRVNEGDTVIIKFSNPDVVPHLIDLPAFKQHSALIPGGEFTLEFVVDKTGTFPFVCSVPGHEEAGMIGVLIVDPIP